MVSTLLVPTVLAMLLVLISKFVVGKNPALRKKITQNVLWKTQFALHPLLIFLVLDRASQQPTTTSSIYYSILIIPFAFNFGVEPYDIPKDPLFLICFYLHHYALILASTTFTFHPNTTPINDIIDDEDSILQEQQQQQLFGRSQALLLGHAWMIHSISYAAHNKWIDKQRGFWAYMAMGFVFMTYYWWCSPSHIVAVASILRLPLYTQYLGRWGLYLRLCIMYGWNEPNHPNYDHFEWMKQPIEFTSFGLSYWIVQMVLMTKT